MADLGNTYFVGPSGLPVFSPFENEKGESSFTMARTVLPSVVRPAPQHVWYEMRGRDQDCSTLTYRYWRVVGAPDFTGTMYTGPKCGVNPLVEIIVLETDISA